MGDAQEPVYVKSALGRAELAARTRSLTGALRTALILIDGQADLQALSAQLGADTPRLVAALLHSGHIERVTPPAPPRPRVKEVAVEPPAPADETLPALRRAALRLLAPHFGPDVTVVAQPLIEATDPAAFERGLDAIERKLAVYLGKGAAAELLAPLRRAP